MWRYIQVSGALYHSDGADHGFRFIANGYSGSGAGMNNPAMQYIPNTGPIPLGHWTIGPPIHHPSPPYQHHLAYPVMRLTPVAGTFVNNRGNFLIHGDNQKHTASDGCIILSPHVRQMIAMSKDHDLHVVGQLGDFERIPMTAQTA